MSDADMYRKPGHLIEALLRQKGWDQEALALVLGTTKANISHLVTGRRKVDAQTALDLSEVFDTEPDRFLDLQKTYDLGKARLERQPDPGRASRVALFSNLPVSEMIRRGWLQADSIRDVAKVESELRKFFGMQSIADIEILPHAAKKSNATEPITLLQLAWIYRVKQVAKGIVVPPYTKQRAMQAVEKLDALLLSAEEIRKVPRILAEAGIRFVIVESLKSAKIEGVCCWLDDKSPVIGMSLRLDRIDNFWFVIRHEIEHVLQGHGKTVLHIDVELEGDRAGTGDALPQEERIANAAAAHFCVPAEDIDDFIARKYPIFTERDIIGFARRKNIHPGLVVGQLQWRTKRYDLLRKYLVKVRSIISPNAMVDGWGDIASIVV